MLQYFPVGRVCSRVFSTGKFQFPFYETKQGKDSVDIFKKTINQTWRTNVCFILSITFTCSWTPHAGKTRAFLNLCGPRLTGGMNEWQCGRLSSARVTTGQKLLNHESDASQQPHLPGNLLRIIWNDTSLCTQIYIYIRNYTVRQYHDFLYMYIHINPFCPDALQAEETSAPRRASAWRRHELWWLERKSVADASQTG